ncbi:MAG: hypothetical protein IPH53_19865 [Flavobacteriales bacterium]|nr:hypothetical protein [Flavobacteriales bacterium]
MRVSLTMVALGLGLGLTAQQNIAINATGAAADNSAILDISSGRAFPPPERRGS